MEENNHLKQSNVIDLNLHYTNHNDSVLTSRIELYIQEIELAIKMLPNDLWGVKYSLDTNRYIFNQYITLNQIKNEISNFIAENCYHTIYFQTDYAIKITNVEGKDLIYLLLEIKELSTYKDSEPIKLEFFIKSEWE